MAFLGPSQEAFGQLVARVDMLETRVTNLEARLAVVEALDQTQTYHIKNLLMAVFRGNRGWDSKS